MGMDHPHQLDPIPLLRGLLHLIAFPLMVIAGAWVALQSHDGKEAVSALLYCAGFAAIFGTSGLYHRGRWTPRARRMMRQLDHCMIYVGMATTYTAFWLVALHGLVANLVLVFAWTGMAVAIVIKVRHIDASNAKHWFFYLGFGMVGLAVVPGLIATMGVWLTALMLAGAAWYALGSVAYVTHRPDPFPKVLGYHELFHAGTIVGAGCQLLALAIFMLN